MAKTGSGRENKASYQIRKGEGGTKKSSEHVVVRGDGWAVRSSTTGRFTKVYPNKSDAIDVGRKLARSEGGELVVHGRSGQISQRSQAPSTINEAIIRNAVRTSSKKSVTKGSTKKSSTKKSVSKRSTKKSAGKSGSKKK